MLCGNAYADIAVTASDIRSVDGRSQYVYSLTASRMAKSSDELKTEFSSVENATLKDHQGTHFVSADAGKKSASIVYCFDFSGIAERPIEVAWRDRLTLFPRSTNEPGLVRITSEWSTDGATYQLIHQAETETGEFVDLGELNRPVVFPLDGRPDKVYYRVRFDAVGDGATFLGNQAQWNRTGNNASLFRAEFVLARDGVSSALPGRARSSGLSLDVSYPRTAGHLIGGVAYPANVLSFDSAEGWKFIGGETGHRGSVEAVDAPQRVREAALRFSVEVDKDDPQARKFVGWSLPLLPPILLVESEDLLLDVFPLDPVLFPIHVTFTREGGEQSHAANSVVTGLEPNHWQTIRVPIRQGAEQIDGLKIWFNADTDEVPHHRPVRLILDNLRAEPTSTLTAEDVVGLEVAGPASVGFLHQTSDPHITDEEPARFSIELGVDQATHASFELIGTRPNGGTYTWRTPVELRSPYTVANIHLANSQDKLGAGVHRYDLRIVLGGGQVVARNTSPIEVAVSSTDAMQRRRRDLLGRLEALREQAAVLEERGIVVDEPCITLEVAQWYLADGGYVEHDYFKQEHPVIGLTQLEDLEELLDRAETELNDRATGAVVEHKVVDYQVGRPVLPRNGQLWQDGKPLLIIGCLTYTFNQEVVARMAKVGFNSIKKETRLADWYGRAEGRGQAFLADYFRFAEQEGLATHGLLSGHYPPKPLPGEFEGARSPHATHPSLPWDVLSPQSDHLFEDWYHKMLPTLENQSTLISLGTANEPGYFVQAQSETFAPAFRSWAKQTYGDVSKANACWGSDYTTFQAIDLPSYFALRKEQLGAEFDWQCFVDEKVTAFFKRRTETLHTLFPDQPIWIKVMGFDKNWGFPQLNEYSNITQAQDVLGHDGEGPMWFDYLKSIDPSKTMYNTEWHFMGKGRSDPRNQALLTELMVRDVVHGNLLGLIWSFERNPWDSTANGADQSITRWAKTIDAVGRTALQLRSLAEPLGQLANLDGGRLRILYSTSANLHQGIEYVESLHEAYEPFQQNSSGTRFVFSRHLMREDLQGVDFLAWADTRYIENDATRIIQDWVSQGGVVWLQKPMTPLDPWGKPLTDIDPHFAESLRALGTSSFGSGRVIVGETPPDLNTYCDGPWAIDRFDRPILTLDIRRVPEERGGYLSIINESADRIDFTLVSRDSMKFTQGYDLWNRRVVDLSKPLSLPPYGVMIVQPSVE